MDIAQIFGDYIHLLGMIILLVKIWLTNNCAGISGKTQLLYALVFTSRFTDVPMKHFSLYNGILKIAYIGINYCTVLLIFFCFKKTYNRKHDAFRIELLILPSAVLALFINEQFTTVEVLQAFGVYLEAVTIVPQVYLVSKSKQIESIVVSYVACLGLYKGCYLMHYLFAYYRQDSFEKIAIACSLVQMIFYCDFFGRNLPILKHKNSPSHSSGTAAREQRRRQKDNNATTSVAIVKGDKTVDVEKNDSAPATRPDSLAIPEKVTLLTSKEQRASN